jgi:hypothetical protein
MKIIHCTKKLLEEIKQPVLIIDELPPESTGLGNWYGNIFRFNRRKILIFTNEQTLFTFFIHGVKKKDLERISDLFRENLRMILNHSGINGGIIDRIITEHLNIDFSKTYSRSVLASMNDYIRIVKFRLEEIEAVGEITEREMLMLSIEANETPMGGIGYKLPVNAMKKSADKLYLADA